MSSELVFNYISNRTNQHLKLDNYNNNNKSSYKNNVLLSELTPKNKSINDIKYHFEKSTLTEQNANANYVFKFIDILTETGNINFVNVSLAALVISTSFFLFIFLTIFVLKLNLCKSKNINKQIDSNKQRYEINCEKHILNTMSSISDKFDQSELISNQLITNDLSLMKRDSTNTTKSSNTNNTNSLLCKCIGKSSAQKVNIENSTYSPTSTTSSFINSNHDKSNTDKQNQLIVINCTSCIDLNRSRLKNNKIIESDKLNTTNNKLSQYSNNNTRSLSLVSTQISKKKNKPKYTTQLSIRFHKFSLRSPSFSTLTRNKQKHNRHLVPQNTQMNQRCCLSVSVVPFDRHTGNNNNSNSKSKKNNKKSTNKQSEDENDSYSKPTEPVTNIVSKNSSNNQNNFKMNKTNESLFLKNDSSSVSHFTSTPTTNTPNETSSPVSHEHKPASLLNHHDFHKIDMFITSKKSPNASINHSSPLMITPVESNIVIDPDKIAKQVAIFKQKNICTKEPSPSLLSQHSSTPINTNSNSSNSTNANELLNININSNLNLNNTISSRYQHFERRKNSTSSNQNDTLSINGNNTNNHTINNTTNNTNNACEEIFDFNLRINKLRFIDDSASSTALTSPAESINHFYNFLNKNHAPQHQHKLLNSYASYGANTQLTVSTSSSTSSSRTVSMAPSTSCSSASTPVSNSSFNNRQISNNPKRMAMPIHRQENVKSSTETLCSNESESLHKPIAKTEVKNESGKQFQHELLENYRKASNATPPHQHLPQQQKNQLQQQQDNEDDEEIKSIILNNLNEKLKSGQSSKNANNNISKQHQRHPKHNSHHHYQYTRKNKSATNKSSASSTNTEIDSSSSECDQIINQRHYHIASFKHYPQQQQIKARSYESSTSSSTTTATSTATTSPQLDYTEIVCKSCEAKNRLNNTNMPTLIVAASESNCKYCKLLLNYESSTSSKNISSPTSISSSTTSASKQLNYQYGYSPVNRFKNKGDDRVYAYENFDCINECLEETDILNKIIDSKIILRKKNLTDRKEVEELEEVNEEEEDEEGEEDDEEETTSILVEDGFIRMSSPVGEDDNEHEENENVNEEKQTDTSELNDTLESKDSQFNKSRIKNPTNFPNVGSSPISEEFLNSDCSSSDEEDAKVYPSDKKDEHNISNDVNSDSFDGIIILSSLKKKKKNNLTKLNNNQSNNKDIEIQNNEFNDIINDSKVTSINKEALSLSDDEEIIVEEDEEEDNDDEFKRLVTPKNSVNSSALISQEEVQSSSENNFSFKPSLSSKNQLLSKAPPHSIMKQKANNYSELNQIVYHRVNNNLEQSSSSSLISSASTNLTSSPCATNTNLNSCASNNFSLTAQSVITSSTSSTSNANANAASSHQKPKVRFNLDINYEKEREWSRASKLIGDASKTQIEWTQEVEV